MEEELAARRIVKLLNGEDAEVHFELLERVWSLALRSCKERKVKMG
jgi:hypothetical protein